MVIDGELSFVLMARKDKTSQKPSLKQVQGGLLSITARIIMTNGIKYYNSQELEDSYPYKTKSNICSCFASI